MRFAVTMVLVLGSVSLAWGCWANVDPHFFAHGCPIIVSGAIESVAEAAKGGERADDIASIRIDAIHRNELKDVGLAVGDILRVRMVSRNNRMRTSTDLNYPKGTKAVWLVVLTSTGEFRIDRHPVQKQPLQFAPKLELRAQKLGKGPDERGDNLHNPDGSKTMAEWVASQKQQEEDWAKEQAAHEARQKHVREIAGLFAKPDGVNEQSWKAYLDANAEVRLSVCQLSEHEQPMDGVRFAEFVRGVLEREKDEHIRTHAVCRLGYSRDPSVAGVETLSAALRDPSAEVRIYACQSVKQRRYEQLTQQVKSLQQDPNAKVREMAEGTLKLWSESPKKLVANTASWWVG